jgi:N-acetyl-anhydromuramyl-L-alanine amidase AmpD
MAQVKFVAATNYTNANRKTIDLIVIHDMEYPERLTAAEDVARYFANQKKGSGGSSAHYNIDNNSIVQSVRDSDVAWAAPGANHDGLQIEHAGYARQTTAQWLDDYSSKMLFEQSAPFVAKKCREYKIPPKFMRSTSLVAQRRGITTHWEVTKAFSHGQGHTDPGPNFPLERYMNAVVKAYSGGTVTKNPDLKRTMPTLRQGMKNHNVKIMQRLLNFEEKRAWDDIKADGIFGPRTEAEVKEFQKRAGLNPDGVVGRYTWNALWAARGVN